MRADEFFAAPTCTDRRLTHALEILRRSAASGRMSDEYEISAQIEDVADDLEALIERNFK